MRTYWTLTRRELAGYFLSMSGYVILASALFLIGYSFVVLLVRLQAEPTPLPITELFYNTQFFWMILLFATPIITMRLFALEKFSGTFETLMTAPVKDSQVVISKFIAAMIFYMVMWLPLLGCIWTIRFYTSDASAFDVGAVGTTFLGIFLVGCAFISVGCLASSLTRSQMTAAMIGLVFSFSLFLLSFLAERVPGSDWKSKALACFNLPDQMHDFATGIVDTRPVVLYLSMTLLFLFLTLRVIETRRWR